jgi:glutaredoxin
MSVSIRLQLYTQPNCEFCDMMKMKLNEWGYKFEVINIKEQNCAKEFLKTRGHKTVPQLYWNKTHLNKVDTTDFTKDNLEEELDYDNYVGGVEQWQ